MRSSWRPAFSVRSPPAKLTAVKAASGRVRSVPEVVGGLRLRPPTLAEARHDLAPGGLGFIAYKDNLGFLGPPGTGKTHLSVGLGEAEAANLFFQLVSSCYERASFIVTFNKPFGRWGEVFGDDVVAAAMIDRLVHHAEVISLKGDSYRLKDRGLGRFPASTKTNA